MPPKRGKRRARNKVFPSRPTDAQRQALYKYLDRIYYDPASGGSYSTPSKLRREVERRDYYRNVGYKIVQQYLNKHNTYTLYKPTRTRFPTPPVHVTAINEQFDMDLMDVSRNAGDNDGVRYLLSAIDVLSKYGYLIPLKTKEGVVVAEAAAEIFDDQQPQRVCTDRGSEYKSRVFQQLLKDRGIHHFFAGGSGHATIVERFNRTMRGRIARYQFKHNSMRYIDALQDLVDSYNKTWHRSIKMRPVDVTADNDHLAYQNLYGSRKRPKQIAFQFEVGESVRISGDKHPFQREFFQRWSEEVFTISKRWRQRNINMYRIKDCAEAEIEGSFYAAELAKVTTAPDDMYRVALFLDEKVENGKKYVKVQWQGYPKECSSWVLKSSVRNI